MNAGAYYRAIFPGLKQSFERSERVLGYGRELIARMGFGPYDLPVTVQPVKELWKLAVEWELEVFVPVLGRGAVLFPFDFEVALKHENSKLYAGPDSQRHYIRKYIVPVAQYLERHFQERAVPYLMDFTPSGGHLLFYALRGTAGWDAVRDIGALENDLRAAYAWTDASGADVKRLRPVSDDEGRVFSGLGRLAEYIGLTIIRDARGTIDWTESDGMEIHLCDAADKAVNIDVSWAGDPLYMRIMRAPGSLHKKNMNYHGITQYGPLTDAKVAYYDGHVPHRAGSYDDVLAAQWDLGRAAEHNARIPGYIPWANEGLVRLVADYRASGLFRLHQRFDRTADLPRGEARRRALEDGRLHEKSLSMIRHPNPRMLQPEALRKMVRDLVDRGWEPRHAGNVIRDCYADPFFGWTQNWLKCPAETRANFWARIYAGAHALENGERVV